MNTEALPICLRRSAFNIKANQKKVHLKREILVSEGGGLNSGVVPHSKKVLDSSLSGLD